MTFQYWPVLLALAIPLAMLVWVWWPKAPQLALPYDHGTNRRGRVWSALLNLASSLTPLLLAIAIVLVAGPQQFGEPKDKRALTNIQLCLDISGSMTTPWGEGSRYDGAIKAIDEFLNFRKGDAFGLTYFGNEFLHWCPLTTDPSAVRCSFPFMRPENAPPMFGGTEIGRAVKACIKEMIKREEGDRMIVLVTDGQSSDLFGSHADDITRELRANNITLFAITVGGEAAQDELYTIANSVGGAVFEAGDPTALAEIFKRVDSMKQAKMEKTLAEAMDHFRPWCIAGLSILGLMGLTSMGLRATPW
jgi:Ca-activated chloride channel family protein